MNGFTGLIGLMIIAASVYMAVTTPGSEAYWWAIPAFAGAVLVSSAAASR